MAYDLTKKVNFVKENLSRFSRDTSEKKWSRVIKVATGVAVLVVTGVADTRASQATEATRLLPKELKSAKTSIAFCLVPAGSFVMGSPLDENNRSRKERQYSVTLSQPFYCGKYEVTQAQWKQVMGNNPSHFKGSDLPVERVNWNDCQTFIAKLCALEGVTNGTYRLLTAAEWEYACRAGTTESYAGDLNAMGWYDQNSEKKTHSVGTKQPNAFGLYDMHGNVWEWCNDWYGDYPAESMTNPTGPATGSFRVGRGGSWYGYARFCRSAYHGMNIPENRDSYLGFRLLRTAASLNLE